MRYLEQAVLAVVVVLLVSLVAALHSYYLSYVEAWFFARTLEGDQVAGLAFLLFLNGGGEVDYFADVAAGDELRRLGKQGVGLLQGEARDRAPLS